MDYLYMGCSGCNWLAIRERVGMRVTTFQRYWENQNIVINETPINYVNGQKQLLK